MARDKAKDADFQTNRMDGTDKSKTINNTTWDMTKLRTTSGQRKPKRNHERKPKHK